jgi:hypothetical protein
MLRENSCEQSIAKPQWVHLESTPAEWLFPQEKATPNTLNKVTFTVISL